ncbi:MAG: hypothetical protein M5U09_02070 [Gammaproteobacteria bacterium]|nr:hypothetical protein [Gammaproteobacteria bacterium]
MNALLLGAMSAQADFPVDLADLEAAIAGRGVAVEANLKGLVAGRRLVEDEPPAAEPETAATTGETGDFSGFPQGVHDILAAAVERLADYQDEDYAREYLERLAPLARAAGTSPEGLAALRETARYLALWMSYEDVMRVAELKTRAGRRRRIRRETGAPDDAPVRVTEFFSRVSRRSPPCCRASPAIGSWPGRTVAAAATACTCRCTCARTRSSATSPCASWPLANAAAEGARVLPRNRP